MPRKKTALSEHMQRPRRQRISDILFRLEPLKSIITHGPVDAALARSQQQEVWHDQTTTFSEAADRVRAACREAESESTGCRALALSANSEAIAASFDQDAFEQCRKEHGLDVVREQVLDYLRGEISFERGFELFKNALAAHRVRIDTWEDLRTRYPDLTASEVSLCALLAQAPRSYLVTGPRGVGSMATGAFLDEALDKEFGANLFCHLVASMHRATPLGINFVMDYVSLDLLVRDRVGKGGSLDPYTDGGVTAAHLDFELVPFRPEVRQAFAQLVVLAISNRKIHQQLFRESDECFTAGFGAILRKAYGQVTDTVPLPTASIMTYVNSLDRDMRAKVERRARELEKNLCKAEIYDLTLKRMLSPEDVFRLIALIQSPPDELFCESGFAGYCGAYGFGVRFIRADGIPLCHRPYRPYFIRTAASNVYYETTDFDNDTPVVGEIFGMLRDEVAAKASENVIKEERPYSKLEEVRLDFYLSSGIDIALLPEEYLEVYEKEGRGQGDYISAHISAKSAQSYSTRKIGFEEATLISRTLGLLPKELLANIKRISKRESDFLSLESLMDGMVKLGQYSPAKKEITMFESPSRPFKTCGPLMRYLYSFTLIHEVGESVWANLAKEQKDGFRAISGWGSGAGGKHCVPKEGLGSHFLSAYSHLMSDNDDFAEHFAFYVMHGAEFRAAASRHGPLEGKYAFIEALFTINGRALRYPQFHNLSIEGIHGQIDAELRRLSFAGGVALQEARMEKRLEETEDMRARIKLTLEEYEEELYGKQDED